MCVCAFSGKHLEFIVFEFDVTFSSRRKIHVPDRLCCSSDSLIVSELFDDVGSECLGATHAPYFIV